MVRVLVVLLSILSFAPAALAERDMPRIDAAPNPTVTDETPNDPGYAPLLQAFDRYRALAATGGWGTVPTGPKLEFGMRDSRVAAMRARLAASGDLSETGADPDLFDAALAQGVMRFQERHGLEADGVTGFKTIDALNVSVEQRLKTIALNLERMRALRIDPARPLVLVNIAGAELDVIENGVVALHSPTIVGRIDRPTPLLESEIDRLEFNPYWNVPVRIAQVDLLPKVRKNKSYYNDLNFRVYSSYGETAREIDPGAVNWYSAEAKKYRLRQDPGPENALGPAKFLFPNAYSVYLHGTSHPELFAKTARYLSSGCIRLPDPLGFAAYLLRDDPAWSRAEIDRVVAAGRNKGVRLARPVPVMLAYRTSWVDAGGAVQFRDDVYGLDRGA